MPSRIQLKRTKGWRKPEGVVVSRPSKWGNPYAVKRVDKMGFYPYGWQVRPEPSVAASGMIYNTEADAAARAVALYRRNLAERIACGSIDLSPLRGHDLACWCPLDQPCHADVLLELANS